MNKTEFIQLIDNPELLRTKQIGELKQILANFPYFIHARVLTTKALHNEKHYEYEKYLKQTALSVPDRDVLYHYLHDLTPHWLTSSNVENIVPEVIIAPVSISIELQQPAINTPTLPIENIVEDLVIEEPVIIEEPITNAEITTEVVVALNAEVIIEDEEVKLTKDEFDVDLAIITLLEGSSVSHNLLDKAVNSITPLPESPIAPAEEDVVNNTQPIIKDDNVAVEERELTFVEWLLQQNSPHVKNDEPVVSSKPILIPNNAVEAVKKVDEVIAVNKTEIIDIPATKPVANDLPEVTKADIDDAVAKSNINNFQNILDKFVKENPSISRPKAEFFNPVNMARQSVEEDDELVTETLANLLYKQGNFKKAIKAYEKLCLLYPSKMSYFASLIQKIKTEQKD